jgi:hypothetical protein
MLPSLRRYDGPAPQTAAEMAAFAREILPKWQKIGENRRKSPVNACFQVARPEMQLSPARLFAVAKLLLSGVQWGLGGVYPNAREIRR